MMVNADGLFRRSKIISRHCQTVRSAYITGHKKIILSGLTCFIMYLIHACNMSEYRLRLLQIDICLDFRIPFLYIQIKCHAGTYTVTIRANMSPNSHGLYAIQNFFDSLHSLHLDFYSSSSVSAVSCFSPSSLSVPFEWSCSITSSMSLDIFTPYSMDSSRMKRISGVLRRFRFFAS